MFSVRKKNFSWIFAFWRQLEHQFLEFTVFKATLNCMQNTYMQYFVIGVIGVIYLKYLSKNLSQLLVLRLSFSTILPGLISYMGYQFWHLCDRTYQSQLSSTNRLTEAVFHLNNRLNDFLVHPNFKENCTLK